MEYSAQTFDIPTLDGISQKQIDVHMGLYQGYVKNVNILAGQIDGLTKLDAQKYAFAIESTRRRMGFEFNGMRMHEFYFPQFVGGAKALDVTSSLALKLTEKYGSIDMFMSELKKVCLSRGPGWCVLAWDKVLQTPHIWWVTEHEMGMLADVEILLTLDMWEHAFMVDYVPAEKANHIDALLRNINWEVVVSRFSV